MHKSSSLILSAAALIAICGFLTKLSPAATENVIYNFCSVANCLDGGNPAAGVIFDSAGNLYGTTYDKGCYSNGFESGNGTVFELSPGGNGVWSETTLYSFCSDYGPHGGGEAAGLTFDNAGNLYSTMALGPHQNQKGQDGAVFELQHNANDSWTENRLYAFPTSGNNGVEPRANVTLDGAGNVYSTTRGGGKFSDGTVFRMTPSKGSTWGEQVIYSFNGKDGEELFAGVTFDGNGNLYGTTLIGGLYNQGTVFELTPAADGTWKEKVLHNFRNNGVDGTEPDGNLVFDTSGNLYGTTVDGGASGSACFGYGCGTVFELSPTASGGWKEKILYSFQGGTGDPYAPAWGLIFDSVGNLYGVATGGGDNCPYSETGCGAVFELVRGARGTWTESTLHFFQNNGTDGFFPIGSLIMDTSGDLYGTTLAGGANIDCPYDGYPRGCGTVFEITP
jgi:uncharacterized repeat protein (TIGR03803 family)